MFSKQTTSGKPASTPAKTADLPPLADAPGSASARKQPKMASMIANDITLEGNVIGDGELHVDGVIRGDVRVMRLSVGETGHIEGSITAEAIENRGRIVGSITAKQVRLLGTCHVDGDITHEQLTMETGAFFQGRSLKFQRQAPAAAAAAPSAKVVDITAAS